MKHQATTGVFENFILTHFPNRNDNLRRTIVKSVFVVSIIALIIAFAVIASHFLEIRRDTKLLLKAQSVMSDGALSKRDINSLLDQNTDFRAWLSIENTNINNPVYQTDDNEFYYKHNQQKSKSSSGALFFDSSNQITYQSADKNLIIYGNKTDNGQLFSGLEKYRSLEFYKQNPTVSLTTFYGTDTYVIYSVFVINTAEADDGGYIYNYTRKKFGIDDSFYNWFDEAKGRSIISTGVEALPTDGILTLVTDADDFDGAKLVVAARKLRKDEIVSTETAVINKNPRYPKIWYTRKETD